MKRISTLAVALFISASSFAFAEPVDVDQVIDSLMGQSPKFTETLTNMDIAPDSRWVPFTMTKPKLQKDMKTQIDRVISYIMPDTFDEVRKNISLIDSEIQDVNKELDALKVGLVTSRFKQSTLDKITFQNKSKSELRDKALQEVKNKELLIIELNERKNELIQSLISKLKEAYQLDVTLEQAHALLYQVNGSDIIQTYIASSILFKAEKQISKILSADISNEAKEKYYSLVVMTRLILLRLSEDHYDQYELWFDKLEEISGKSDVLIKTNKKLLSAKPSQNQAAALKSNIKVNETIIAAVSKYRTVLDSRMKKTAAFKERASYDVDVAISTYKTVKAASALKSLIDESSRQYDHLMELKTPDLIPFEDTDLNEHFLSLSEQLLSS